MRRSHKLVLLSTVSLAALAAVSGAARAADTVCTGSMTGAIAGNLVVPANGSCTLFQANVSGNVRVSQNASLTVNGLEEWSSIGGNVIANACAATLLEGTVTVGGNVRSSIAPGPAALPGRASRSAAISNAKTIKPRARRPWGRSAAMHRSGTTARPLPATSASIRSVATFSASTTHRRRPTPWAADGSVGTCKANARVLRQLRSRAVA